MTIRPRDTGLGLGLGLALALAGALAASAQPAPPKGDHYQCYPAEQEEAAKGVKVILTDQFGKRGVVTGAITRLCNPASKQVQDKTYPVVDDAMHLVCVRIADGQPGKPVKVRNQFGLFTLKVGAAQELCLPSSKIIITPGKG